MQVGKVMSAVTAVVGPEHTLRQAAERMVQHNTGAAIVMDNSLPGPHVITERDLLHAVAAGLNVETQRVSDHMNNAVITAAPTWSIARAAELMVSHGVRHVLVFDAGELVGVLSMRDVVRTGIVTPNSMAVESA
jgi:signal-transduction protein with cAMP-binding, CBS, and nucleotidyltransferase domain